MRDPHYKPAPALSSPSPHPLRVGPCLVDAFRTCGVQGLLAGHETCSSCRNNPSVLKRTAEDLRKRLRQDPRLPTYEETVLWVEYQKTKRRSAWGVSRQVAPPSLEELHALMDACGGLCAYCKQALFESFVHETPLRAGGTNASENLCPACHACSAHKRGRPRKNTN